MVRVRRLVASGAADVPAAPEYVPKVARQSEQVIAKLVFVFRRGT
jgi:hypothetical protein